MQTFKIEVFEMLSKIIPVIANSLDEAKDIVREAYENQEIILDSENFIGVIFCEINEDE